MVYCAAFPLPRFFRFLTPRIGSVVIEAQTELDNLRSLDPRTVAAVHERYFAELFRYARFRTGDAQVAEDIASEALVRLLEAVSSGKGPATSLRGWLMGTLSNLVNDHFRLAYGRPTDELSEELRSNGPDLGALAEEKEQKAVVRQALGGLTAEQQHVLSLRFGSELSLEETAQAMDRSVNAIKALQFRALASLRRELEARRP
jgi:RNA polymerase sigma-70 factor (ECF subfamily)